MSGSHQTTAMYLHSKVYRDRNSYSWGAGSVIRPHPLQHKYKLGSMKQVKHAHSHFHKKVEIQMRVSPGSANLSQFNWQTAIRPFVYTKLPWRPSAHKAVWIICSEAHRVCVSPLSYNNWCGTSCSHHVSSNPGHPCSCTGSLHSAWS